MESIFYVDISETELSKGQKQLPIYKQTRLLTYEGGRLQIYFSHLPQALLTKKTFRKKNSWLFKLADVVERARVLLEKDEDESIIFSGDLSKQFGEKRSLPVVLYAVCLKQKRMMSDAVSITLPKEGGFLLEENILWLLKPYLSRINAIAFVGEETRAAGTIEAYLYEEYGILSSYSKKPQRNTIWIDLSDKADPGLARYASENGIYHLNDREVLKFLDTIVKNGYNTEVD